MTRTQVKARRWWILGVLILALFGVSLDNTILNVALPTLAHDLSASASQLQWMVDAYILVFAGLLLVAGALSDRYGRRRALVIGLALFGLGSALAPVRPDRRPAHRCCARSWASAPPSRCPPRSRSSATSSRPTSGPRRSPPGRRSAGLGIVVGPVLGGWLLEHFAWGSVFLVNVPFVIVGIVAALAVIPESRAPGRVAARPDRRGPLGRRPRRARVRHHRGPLEGLGRPGHPRLARPRRPCSSRRSSCGSGASRTRCSTSASSPTRASRRRACRSRSSSSR